jgi:hypothetical protein
MKKATKLKSLAALFFSGYVQVYFIAANTYFLSNNVILGVIISSFMISIIWSFNVKKVAFGSTAHRIVYALGATLGSVFGLLSSEYIAELCNNLTK